eukprot:SM000240S08605  [mRNA]  locus=s240:98267:103716:+ [translate_table: standard]
MDPFYDGPPSTSSIQGQRLAQRLREKALAGEGPPSSPTRGPPPRPPPLRTRRSLDPIRESPRSDAAAGAAKVESSSGQPERPAAAAGDPVKSLRWLRGRHRVVTVWGAFTCLVLSSLYTHTSSTSALLITWSLLSMAAGAVLVGVLWKYEKALTLVSYAAPILMVMTLLTSSLQSSMPDQTCSQFPYSAGSGGTCLGEGQTSGELHCWGRGHQSDSLLIVSLLLLLGCAPLMAWQASWNTAVALVGLHVFSRMIRSGAGNSPKTGFGLREELEAGAHVVVALVVCLVSTFQSERLERALIAGQITWQEKAEQVESERDKAIAARAESEADNIDKISKMRHFISYIFHEIRVPFNAVVLGIGHLLASYVSDEQREILRMMESSSTSMIRILNDVLDYGKIESGKLQLERAPFSMGEVVNSLMWALKDTLDSKWIKFDLIIDDATKLLLANNNLLGDKHRVQQVKCTAERPSVVVKHKLKKVLANYLSNAVKFTPRGGRVVLRVVCNGVYTENGRLMPLHGARRRKARTSLDLLWKGDTGSDKWSPGYGNDPGGRGMPAGSLGPGWQVTSGSSLWDKAGADSDPVDDDASDDDDYTLKDLGAKYPAGSELEAVVRCGREVASIGVSVEDSGVGISKEDQAQLFEPYMQISAGSLQAGGGTGLGLCFAKKIVELAGGCIGVYSEVGRGSIFLFTIPFELSLVEPHSRPSFAEDGLYNGPRDPYAGRRHTPEVLGSQQNSSSSEMKSSTAGEKAKVLVVEDNMVNRKILRKLLSSFDIACDEAEDGRKAVEICKSGRSYDMILIDKEMPVMDGHEATRELRAMGIKTPIVGLTGNALDSDRNQFLAAGVDEFLTKPLSRDQLVKLLEQHCLIRKHRLDSATPT